MPITIHLKTIRCLSIILLFVLLMLLPAGLNATIATSSDGVDTLPDKIFDDLVIRDNSEISKKLSEIQGDLILSSEKINVTVNQVTGNINAIGSEVYVGGRIRQSCRMLGRIISTDATIGRNLSVVAFPSRKIFIIGSRVEVLRDCSVGKDVDIQASDIYLDGEISGMVRLKGENITLAGTFQENVEVEALKSLRLQPSCRIEGVLTYSSPKKAVIEEGAQVMSGEINYTKISRTGLFSLSWSWRLTLGFAALIVGLVFTMTCRSQIKGMTDTMLGSFGQSLGIGFISIAVMILYTALYFVTAMFSLFYQPVFVLVPLLTIVLIILALMFYFANILVAIFLGRLIVMRLTDNKQCSPGRSLVIGMVILVPLYAIPYIGNVIFVLTLMLGFGTFVIEIFRRYRAMTAAQ